MRLPSLVHTISDGDRSHSSVRPRTFPDARSIKAMRRRSDSYPGRAMRNHASVLPSGEKCGCVSVALLSSVMHAGEMRPSLGTVNTSRFVDHIMSRVASWHVYATVRPSGEM